MRKKNNNPTNGNKKNTNRNQNNKQNNTRRKNNNINNNKNKKNNQINIKKKKTTKKVTNTPVIKQNVEDKFSFVSEVDNYEEFINNEIKEEKIINNDTENNEKLVIEKENITINDKVEEVTINDNIPEENIEDSTEELEDLSTNPITEKSVNTQIDDIVIVDSNLTNEEINDNSLEVQEEVNKFEFVEDISTLLDNNINEEKNEIESEDLTNDAYNQIVDQDTKEEEKVEELIPEMEEVVNEAVIPVSATISENLSSGKVVTGNNKKKLYLSFEIRVVIMLIAILSLFLVACTFVFEAVTTSGNKVVYYDENSTIDYKVCVTQNNFYNGNCLNSGMQYVSSITDTIPTTFNYDVDFSTEIEYDLDYRVVGVLNVVDKTDPEKVLYTTEDVLVQSTELKNIENGIHFQTNLEIPYKKYNQFITDYITKYSLSANAYLDVILYLDETTGERAIASMNVPLGVSTYNITEKLTSNENRKVEIATKEWNSYSVSCAVIGVLCILISLIFVMKLTSLVTKVVNNRNNFQKELNKILRENDSLIVTAKEEYEISKEKKKVKVVNFHELVDARNAVNKPIVYVKINDVKSEFYVEDNDVIYYYVMKEADFGKK